MKPAQVRANFKSAWICTAFFLLNGCLSSSETVSSDSPGSPPASNRAPSISGTPSTEVIVGQSYSFVPNASDPDGDSLVFSVANLPNWASFDASDGGIRGVPPQGSEGTHANIQISVSDGSLSSSLNPFTLDVTQGGMGSVTLTIAAPATNTDGSAATDLAGFNIYYGMSSGEYPNAVSVDNPGISDFVVENLSSGTWHFVATARNQSGHESGYSNEVTHVVE